MQSRNSTSFAHATFRTIGAFLAMLLVPPLPALATSDQSDTVAPPDASYVAAELQRANDVLGALSAPSVVRPVLDESRIDRHAARAFTAFAVVDPATGKAVPRSASIVLHSGPHKGQSVNAGAYWDQVNALEKAATAVGASLRETKPLVTGVLRFKAAAISSSGGGGAGKSADALLKSIGTRPALQSPPYAPSGTPALLSQKAALTATLHLPQPCLNAPTSDVRSVAKQVDMDALGPSAVRILAPPTPVPTPTPSPASGTHAILHAGPPTTVLAKPFITPSSPPPAAPSLEMKSAHFSGLEVDEIALEQQKCPNPISPLPTAYNEADLASFFGPDQTQALQISEIGDRSVAAVDFAGNVTVGVGQSTARKPAPIVTAAVSAKAFLFESESDFLSETATAGGEKNGSIDIEILGQSVASPTLKTGQNSGGTNNSYTIVNVNVPIPIIAGINVDLAANVSGTLGSKYSIDVDATNVEDSVALEGIGNLNGTFTASLDVNAFIVDVSGGVSGNMTFASFDIPASGELALEMVDRTIGGKNDRDPRHIRDCQLHFSSASALGSTISALSGNVYVFARECIEYLVGETCSEQDVTIANFNGTTLSPSAGAPWKSTAVGPWYTDGPSYGIPLQSDERFSPDDPKTAIPHACERFPIQYAT
jgi:hypothetical protein